MLSIQIVRRRKTANGKMGCLVIFKKNWWNFYQVFSCTTLHKFHRSKPYRAAPQPAFKMQEDWLEYKREKETPLLAQGALSVKNNQYLINVTMINGLLAIPSDQSAPLPKRSASGQGPVLTSKSHSRSQYQWPSSMFGLLRQYSRLSDALPKPVTADQR